MPQTLLGIFYGNVAPIVFAGFGLAFASLRRYPFLAGMLLVTAWLKPSIALPMVMLTVLFLTADRLRVSMGFLTATALCFGLTTVVVGPEWVHQWIVGLLAYSRDISAQPELAPLSGLYAHSVSAGVRQIAQLVTIGTASLATAAVWWRRRGHTPVRMLDIAWLWALWYISIPYAHIDDTILLTAPILALIGRNGLRATWWLPALSLYCVFVSVVHLPFNVVGFDLEPLGLLGVVVCLAIAAWSPRYRDDRLPDTQAHAPYNAVVASR
jgi:hypothetical protein